MNMLVSAATVATASPIEAASDPVFAAIEKHRQAYAALSIEIVKTDDLEASIPKERRKSSIAAWEEEIVETDDPRWIEHQRKMQACSRAEEEATCELAAVIPTGPKGMLALLEYTTEHEENSGCEWTELYENETSKWARSFLYFVSKNIVQTLRGMTA
jgi:hypothetical protein